MWGWPLIRSVVVIMVTTAVAAVVAYTVLTLRPASYQAQAVVDVTKVAGQPEDFSNTDVADRTLADQLLVARSSRVLNMAARDSGIPLRQSDDVFAADTVEGANAIAFTAVNGDPRGAAIDANAYARAYVNFSLTTQASLVDSRRGGLTEIVDNELETLNQLNPDVSEEVRDAAISQLGADLADLARADAELQRRSASGILVQPAQPPEDPAGPSPLLGAAIAGFLAAIVTFAIVFIAGGSPRSSGGRRQR